MNRDEAREALARRGIPFDEERVFKYLKSGELDVVQLFLDAGVPPFIRSESGEAAVVIAARAGHKEIVELLLSAGAYRDELINALKDKPKKKDIWEKISSLSAVFAFCSSVMIGGVGWYFTKSYNERQAQAREEQDKRDAVLKEQQNRITEMQAVEKMIPHLGAGEDNKKAALLSLSVLASPELATRMAEAFGGEGSVEVLENIAKKGEPVDRPRAVAALTNIAVSGSGASSTAALEALGSVFAGKEKSLVKILVGGGKSSCTGFVVDGRRGVIATTNYCTDEGGPYLVRTWEDKAIPVKSVVQPRSAHSRVSFLIVGPSVLPYLDFSKEPIQTNSRVVGIGYALGRMRAMPGKVIARAKNADDVEGDYVMVSLDEKIAVAGSGGGPFLDQNGDVACMYYSSDPAHGEMCVPAQAVKSLLEEVSNLLH